MQVIGHKPHIHIINSDPDTTGALTCMLESHKLDVDCYANAEDLMRSDSIVEDDVIIVELDEKRPRIFQFLHRLIYESVRPGIIIACQKASSIEASDLFPTQRIEVVFHPFTPGDLLSAIDRLTLPVTST